MSVETERRDGEKGLGEHLRMVAGAIGADGRVDFDETTRLLEILKPLGEFDAKAVELRKAVEEVRAAAPPREARLREGHPLCNGRR